MTFAKVSPHLFSVRNIDNVFYRSVRCISQYPVVICVFEFLGICFDVEYSNLSVHAFIRLINQDTTQPQHSVYQQSNQTTTRLVGL